MSKKTVIIILGIICLISSSWIFCLLNVIRDIYFTMSFATIVYGEIVFFGGLFITENIAKGNKEVFIRSGFYSSLFIFAAANIGLALLNGPDIRIRTYYALLILFAAALSIALIIIKKTSNDLGKKDNERQVGYDNLQIAIERLVELRNKTNNTNFESIIDGLKYSDPKTIDLDGLNKLIDLVYAKFNDGVSIDDELSNIKKCIDNKKVKRGGF